MQIILTEQEYTRLQESQPPLFEPPLFNDFKDSCKFLCLEYFDCKNELSITVAPQCKPE